MARTLVRHTVRTDTGAVVISAKVEPLVEGTTTAISDAYAAETGGSAITSVLTNAQGEAVFWMDTYRDQIDLRVSPNGTAYLPGASATLFSFATFTETVALPAPTGTLVRVPAAAGLNSGSVLVPDTALTEGVKWAFLAALGFARNVKDSAATSAQRADVGSGVSKPLSTYYATLAAAQAAYPLATALTQELDVVVSQTALNAVAPGGVLVYPPGSYLLAGGAKVGGTAVALDGGANVTVIGYGAHLLQTGAANTRVFGIFNCNVVTIEGFRITGSTQNAGVLAAENNAGITVNYNSSNVRIRNCYITNFLGDCIYIGGSLADGGQTGFTSRNVSVTGCVLKERYGDGVRSSSLGTRSRFALVVVDAIGVKVKDNDIYGQIDCEPNLNSQNLQNINVGPNTFLSGPVTPQTAIGTTYNHDEPIVAAGTAGSQVIGQGVSFTGIPASPVVANNVVHNNTFESGVLSMSNPYVAAFRNNTFAKGLIIVGATSGSNTTSRVVVEDNSAAAPLSGETTFIKLAGMVYSSRFVNNNCDIGTGFVINNSGASTGDGGRNYFSGNTNTNGASSGALGFTPLGTSVSIGNWNDRNVADERPRSERIAVKEIRHDLVYVTLTAANQVLDYRTFGGNRWVLDGNGFSLAEITNMPDGTELTIMSGAFGGGTVTIVHNVNLFRLQGGVNFVMNSADWSITFVRRTFMQEISRKVP